MGRSYQAPGSIEASDGDAGSNWGAAVNASPAADCRMKSLRVIMAFAILNWRCWPPLSIGQKAKITSIYHWYSWYDQHHIAVIPFCRRSGDVAAIHESLGEQSEGFPSLRSITICPAHQDPD